MSASTELIIRRNEDSSVTVIQAGEYATFRTSMLRDLDPGLVTIDGVFVIIKADNGTWRYRMSYIRDHVVHAFKVGHDEPAFEKVVAA